MVDSRLDGLSHKELSTSACDGQTLETPIAYWIRAAALIVVKNRLAELELGSKQQLPEDLSASDFDVVRARALSNLI